MRLTGEFGSLLAFGFAAPAMLGWLVLAAVPILIHWLFRHRYREVVWGAMQFLHEAIRKQSRRVRLEQLLLLLARISLLVLAVLAMAGPRWGDAGSAGPLAIPTLRIVVLDCSLSMSRRTADTTDEMLFDSAKRIAREVIGKATAGDRLVLARIAGSEPRLVIRQPTLLARTVLDEIDRTAVTFERGDVAATLRAVLDVAANRPGTERCEITIISDFQSDNWAEASLSELSQLGSVALTDVGTGDLRNATVAGLEFDTNLVGPEQPLRVSGTVRNSGSRSLAGRRVELLLNGQVIDTQPLESAGDDAVIGFDIVAPAVGEHLLAARLDDDALTADNQFWRALSVRSEIKVLLLNGRSASRDRESATFYLERALAPNLRALPGPETAQPRSRWHVRTLPESELATTDLKDFDVVFLCDPPRLTEADAERLRRFVAGGGGLIVSLGPSTDVTNLNETLLGSRGVMPVALTGIVGPQESTGVLAAVGFDLAEESHPLLREFRGNPGSGLESALIQQFVRADVVPASAVQVPVRFTSGEPAILTHSLQAGRCVLITTSVDETWGAWAVFAPGFVPLMHELVSFVVPGSSDRQSVLVGESISRSLRSVSADDSIVAVFPNGDRRPIHLVDHGGTSSAAVPGSHRPGAIQLQSQSDNRIFTQIAVNIDPRESDSRRLDPESLKRTGQWTQPTTRPADSTTGDPESNRFSLARWGLLLVLSLLLVEFALAWRLIAAGWVLASIVLVATLTLLAG